MRQGDARSWCHAVFVRKLHCVRQGDGDPECSPDVQGYGQRSKYRRRAWFYKSTLWWHGWRAGCLVCSCRCVGRLDRPLASELPCQLPLPDASPAQLPARRLSSWLASSCASNLPTKNIPTNICGKSPMDMIIPPLNAKILLESSPQESRILVRRLAVMARPPDGPMAYRPDVSSLTSARFRQSDLGADSAAWRHSGGTMGTVKVSHSGHA